MEDGTQSQREALVKVPEVDLEPLPQRSGSLTEGVSAPAEQTGVNHLAMNVFVPGLGSLVRGHSGMGVAQFGLSILGLGGIFTGHFLFGLLMIIGAWGWSVAVGIGFLKSKKMEWR